MVQILGFVIAIFVKVGGLCFRPVRKRYFPNLQRQYELRRMRREETLLGYGTLSGTGATGPPVAARVGMGARRAAGLHAEFGADPSRAGPATAAEVSAGSVTIQGLVNGAAKGLLGGSVRAAGLVLSGGGADDEHSPGSVRGAPARAGSEALHPHPIDPPGHVSGHALSGNASGYASGYASGHAWDPEGPAGWFGRHGNRPLRQRAVRAPQYGALSLSGRLGLGEAFSGPLVSGHSADVAAMARRTEHLSDLLLAVSAEATALRSARRPLRAALAPGPPLRFTCDWSRCC